LGLDPNDGGNVNFEYPNALHISGITFQSATAADVLHLDSAAGVIFEDVNFIGPINGPDGTETRNTCVAISSLAAQSNKIVFRDCRFSGLSYGASVGADVDGVVFDNCTFDNLFQGVIAPTSPTPPKNIKITNSSFDMIYSSAIVGGVAVSGIVSSNNTYTDVGNRYTPEANSVAFAPVIVFRADNNYSIADAFSRSPADSSNVPRVSSAGYAVISASIDDAFALGTARHTAGKQVTLADATSSTVLIPDITHGIIGYSMVRNTVVRSGTIKFATASNNTVVSDEEYTETSDAGITTRLTSSNGSTNLVVSLSSAGHDAVLNFDVKTLH
jgi:hypothetical protein